MPEVRERRTIAGAAPANQPHRELHRPRDPPQRVPMPGGEPDRVAELLRDHAIASAGDARRWPEQGLPPREVVGADEVVEDEEREPMAQQVLDDAAELLGVARHHLERVGEEAATAPRG